VKHYPLLKDIGYIVQDDLKQKFLRSVLTTKEQILNELFPLKSKN